MDVGIGNHLISAKILQKPATLLKLNFVKHADFLLIFELKLKEIVLFFDVVLQIRFIYKKPFLTFHNYWSMNKFKSYLFFILQVFFYSLSLTASGQQTIAEWNFPSNPDNATVDVSVPINSAAVITTAGGTGAVIYSNVGATTFSASCTGWDNGNALKYWEITIATSGYINLSVSSKQFSSATGPRDFKIQYRIGAGVWTDLPGATAIVAAANYTSGVVNSIALPVACENQPAISLRWIMTSNINVGGGVVGSTGNSRIDDLNISWNVDHYYRSISNGNWTNITTWESSPDNITWNAAFMPPSNFSRTVTVRNTHTVTVSSNIRTDETIVESGGTLNWTATVLTLANGTGVDLQVDGTLSDNSPANITFNAGATWALGAGATVIKTSAGSANNWRDNYNGGIVNIPASATWFIRKTGAPNPSVSTLNMYYPNLIIESNVAGLWLAAGSSGFQGAASNTIIKGSMDVGGTGTGNVEFENINNNISPTVVLGSLTVRTGNILRNYGTGFEIYGNLTCDGTITYDATDARRIVFTGSGAQSISGSGTLNIFNLVMNKSLNDLTLNRAVKTDNNLTFNIPGGRIFTTAANLLTLESIATVTNATNTGFVHGPVRKLGTAAFTFPVGKNNDYQAIGIGVGAGGGGSVFWTEDFATGCNAGFVASSYSGMNGNWTITNTGLNEVSANTFYVSAAENGAGAGNCGAGCGANQTLHVGSTTPVDPGAAYLETDAFTCSFIGICSATDKRVESPIINCTGQTGISLLFNYIEFGEGTSDNATLWYFDGAVWSQLADMPKTLCCGSATCNGSLQGLWTAYTIALPASANNNANVKLGFRWVNNANGIATDPSFAVDDIRLSVIGPVESFTAEYFKNNPQVDYNNVVNPFIDHISQCEYWVLTRDAGTSNRTVTLTWDGNSCGVTNLSDLTVARFNSLSWDDRGNGGTTGTTAAGTITSATAQTDYGPFTLASISLQNPLPVELISFDAKYKSDYVDVRWTTATEINSSYFNVLRSQDGILFYDNETYKAAGNSTSIINYIHRDYDPLPAVSYYQLKQVDYDGTAYFSQTIAVRAAEYQHDFSLVTLAPQHAQNQIAIAIYSGSDQKINAVIFDKEGRRVFSEIFYLQEGLNALEINAINLSGGIYALQLSSVTKSITSRFIFSQHK